MASSFDRVPLVPPTVRPRVGPRQVQRERLGRELRMSLRQGQARGFRIPSAILTTAVLLTGRVFLTAPNPETALSLRVLFGAIGNHIVTVDQGTGKTEGLGNDPELLGAEGVDVRREPRNDVRNRGRVTNSKLARHRSQLGARNGHRSWARSFRSIGPKRHLVAADHGGRDASTDVNRCVR